MIAFTVFYFADVSLRASEKYFWTDEIFTLYLVRLDNLSLWHALSAGVDFNPLPFYWVTKLSVFIAGENLVGLRLPEMLGFWIFCLCVFWFVSRYYGTVAGFIAMSFPIFTGAFYYAYEARPHGIVLGFAGLALLFWQRAEDSGRFLWLIPFSCALYGALMMHTYAAALIFPFALLEIYRSVADRSVKLKRWIPLVAPVFAALAVYLPLLVAYRGTARAGGKYETAAAPHISSAGFFYEFLLNPCFLLIVSALVLAAIACLIPGRRALRLFKPVSYPVVLAFGFIALPFIGIAIAGVTHSLFYFRYVLATVFGICLCLAMLFRSQGSRLANACAFIFALTLACTGVSSLAHVAWHRIHGYGEPLREPSTLYPIDTTPGDPLNNESVLYRAKADAPIATDNVLAFTYLAHYAPAIRSRLFYVPASADEQIALVVGSFRRWGPAYNPPDTFAHFIATHRKIYLLSDRPNFMSQLSEMTRNGWRIRSVETEAGQNLVLLDCDAQCNSGIDHGRRN